MSEIQTTVQKMHTTIYIHATMNKKRTQLGSRKYTWLREDNELAQKAKCRQSRTYRTSSTETISCRKKRAVTSCRPTKVVCSLEFELLAVRGY